LPASSLFNSTTDAHNKPDAAEAEPFLKPGGKIMLEFGDGQADAVRKIFETEKWIVEAVKEDYSQRARILVARASRP
jgi:methylase of polypeptide subunit release factors